ncbi:MAG: glycosyltransferase [Acidobacteriaceae bacterium]|nr:glycosyltransferase [Acidobacteriaceae bacterium]
MSEFSSRPLNLLWVIDIDYSTRLHHGAMLRFINYSRRLVAASHRVYFLVEARSEDFRREREFLGQLRAADDITDFFECSYRPSPFKNRLATLALLPSLANLFLCSEQSLLVNESRELARRLEIDVCLFSNRRLFFLVSRLARQLPCIVDFGDSYTLYRLRELKVLWQNRNFRAIPASARELIESFLKERYYSRRADANIAVSPVDKQTLDRINGAPRKNFTLLNGVAPASSGDRPPKTPRRLIFSGNMNFPPNYESALWFIDHVFPLVLRSYPDAEFVVAGANPVPQLLNRASGRIRVTGFVQDMAAELASSALYIAPMIMGGGFKNKVVEALINRTYVAATPMAVEFLGPEAARQMLVASSPESLAAHIVRFLSRPEEFEPRLANLHALVAREFSWEHRTAELLDIVRRVLSSRPDHRLEAAPALSR